MPQITSNHIDLYVTRIWSFHADYLIAHHQRWIDEITRRSNGELEGMSQRSVRQGWKTGYDLFETDPSFAPLREAIESCAKHAFKGWRASLKSQYRVAGSINLAFPGGYNRQHGHEGVLAAGVYYIQVPEDSGCISFVEPRPAAKYSPLLTAMPFGSENRNLHPKPGDMFIFPGWLEHSVETNNSDQPRISIPFNIYPAF